MLVGIVLFVIINLIAAFQIFMRFADLGFSTTWTEEVARYLLVVMVFVGAPYAMRNNDNISIRPLFRLVPVNIQKVLITFSNIMIVAFSLLVIYAVYEVSERTLGVTLATVNWLTVGYAQVVLGIMFGIVILFAIEETVNMWQSDEAPIKSETDDSDMQDDDVAVPDGEGGD